MASFDCEKCGHPHHIFGEGYLNQIKNQFGINNTVSLPLQSTLAHLSDIGKPQVIALPEEHTINKLYNKLADQVENELKNLEGKSPPVISYDENSNKLQIHIQGQLTHQLLEISPKKLRSVCSCALCIDEFSGKKLLKDEQIPENVKPTGIQTKGNYAVAIQWSDGHKTSIYPYTLIQEHAVQVE
ncbi:hypothetical protein PPERSA_12159 [Pseudocohnilembus persalinus]|uniref:Gamma-butyrobetaine hydroxylase-like N-terminal domain-containing protein n=1 Tax=Pseudocohnilembus persalinus TaxID=266149 RepID=A0A0V0R6U9_PSEPJ|nr:hypothetical protein PPERSA_12159 [Pseudocohnilembus persalinus]|eukprot:KRX10201.1 hypothetical protein PPERSA_12159 [Pseudocohnilembus persalinus]